MDYDNSQLWTDYLGHLKAEDLDKILDKITENEDIYPESFKMNVYVITDLYLLLFIEDCIQEHEDLLPPLTNEWLDAISGEWGPNAVEELMGCCDKPLWTRLFNGILNRIT